MALRSMLPSGKALRPSMVTPAKHLQPQYWTSVFLLIVAFINLVNANALLDSKVGNARGVIPARASIIQDDNDFSQGAASGGNNIYGLKAPRDTPPPATGACAATNNGDSSSSAKRSVEFADNVARSQERLWNNAITEKPLYIGGVELFKPQLVMIDENENLLEIPLTNMTLDMAKMSGELSAIMYGPADLSRLAPVVPLGVDVVIAAPQILANANAPIIPDGFTLSGGIKLFKRWDGQLYSSYTCDFGTRQIVVLNSTTLSIADLIPSLANNPVAGIQLQNADFVYNQFTTGLGKAGTWLEADLVLPQSLEAIGNAVSTILPHDGSPLRIKAFLSPRNDWSSLSVPKALNLEKNFPNINARIGNILNLTQADIQISVGEGLGTDSGKTGFGFQISGTSQLHTPNDLAPLDLNYVLRQNNGMFDVGLYSGNDGINNLFGISGFNLKNLSMTASLNPRTPSSALDLQAKALLAVRGIVVPLEGYYNQTDWGFHGALQNVTFDDVRNMYQDLFGSPLVIPPQDIVLRNLEFTAGSSGLLLSGAVSIGGHTSAQAQISLNELGLDISGEVDDFVIAKDVVLRKAALDVSLGKVANSTSNGTRSGISMKFEVLGEISILSNVIKAALFLSKGSSGGPAWTVYGEFDPTFRVGSIAKPLNGTFLDLGLSQACFIASNMDQDQSASLPIPVQFPVIKGVQIAAAMDPIPIFDKAMNNKGAPTVGLSLQAMYLEESSAFELKVNLGVAQTMSMKKDTVTSGEVSLELMTAPSPTLAILASFFVKTAHQDDPLRFTGGLSANLDEAKLFVEMGDQYWVNPFGLSPQLRIGPHPALQVGIVYESPIYPSEIGVSGGLGIGHVRGQAALSISDAPNDELIMMEVDDLGVRDLVDFASLLLQQRMPKVEDFVRFKKVAFYLSSGTTIGTKIYPPGASFECDALIFGKEASVYVGVEKSKGMIAVNGSLDPIEIGPLYVGGVNKGTKANLDIEISPSSQKILIDGDVRLLSFETALFVDMELLPRPVVNISAKLAFSSDLDFELQARMRGGSLRLSNIKDLQNLDFEVHVLFEQDILQYVSRQVNSQVTIAKQAVDGGMDTAQRKLQAAQADFEAKLKQAEANLATAKTAYDAKLSAAQGALTTKQAQVDQDIDRLGQAAKQAAANLQTAIDKAQSDVKSAIEQQALKVQQAQQRVKDAKQQGDDAINGHLKDLNNAKSDMDSKFGKAQKSLDDAQAKVRDAQSKVNSAKRDSDRAQHDFDSAPFYRKPDRGAVLAERKAAVLALETGLKAANKILDAAKSIVNGPGYKAAQAAINGYQKAVTAARSAADAALKAANSALSATVAAQNQLVAAANKALDVAKTTGTEALNAASSAKALSDYKAVADGSIKTLQSAVDAVGSAAEKIAFDAANQAIAIARANTKDIDVAKNALKVAQESADAVLQASAWAVSHATSLLNIRKAEATGDLRGLASKGTALKFSIDGTFAGHNVSLSVDFTPGQGEALVQNVFKQLIAKVKDGILRIA